MTVFTSSYPTVRPEQQHSGGVFDFTLTSANPHFRPEKVALVDALTGKQLTYGELAKESLRFADGLTRVAKLQRGQSVLLFSPNSILYPVFLFAGQAAGLVVSTANSSYLPDELAHAIHLADAGIVLASADALDVAQKACKEAKLPTDRVYVVPGADGKLPSQLPHGMKSYETLRGSDSFKPVLPSLEQAKKDLAYLPFSSGTTGKAKGVALSAHNITTCVLQTRSQGGLFSEVDTVLSVLPMYHIFGLVVMLHLTFYNGGTCVVLPKFDLVKALESVQKFKCTTALVVPPIALALAKHPIVDKFDLTSLRYILCGAAPLSADLENALYDRLKGRTRVFQGLGMTETTSVAMVPPDNKGKPGYVGQLLSTMEARLVSPEGEDVPPGQAGELWLRGPNILLAYHKNEKATRETLTSDGWLMTGDVCERDDEGFYRVVERTKDLIKYKGFQVAPAEVEGVLLTCPLVADCAVIGVYSEEQATELPRAYIVPNPEHAKSPTLLKDVAAYVAEKLAPHKRLRGGVIVLGAIPKSPSGKILRKDLRVLAAQEKQGKAKL
ncbi:acyl--CoA ligase [Rhodotorula paludigena]|uniref:acyl--CoA ligase n=1 Tax=Rhodotorula paludigena TaxID=86838 RepID=UPI00317FFBD5